MRGKELLRKSMFMVVAVLVGLCLQTVNSQAGEHGKKKESKPAILLVTFGTSVDRAKASFDNIDKQVKAAFPGV